MSSQAPKQSRIKEMLRAVPLSQLERFGFGNPNVMTKYEMESLRHSMDNLGVIAPLIVREMPLGGSKRFEIIDGHHRFDVLCDRGDSCADVVVLDLSSDVEARAALLAFRGVQGSFDAEKLDEFVRGMLNDNVDLTWIAQTTGLGSDDLSAFDNMGADFVEQFIDKDRPKESELKDVVPTNSATFTVNLTVDENIELQAILLKVKKKHRLSNTQAMLHIVRTYKE